MRRCPLCRKEWEEGSRDGHPWLRRTVYVAGSVAQVALNSPDVLRAATFWPARLASGGFSSISSAATQVPALLVAAQATFSTPLAVACTGAATAALALGGVFYMTSERAEDFTRRLQQVVRGYGKSGRPAGMEPSMCRTIRALLFHIVQMKLSPKGRLRICCAAPPLGDPPEEILRSRARGLAMSGASEQSPVIDFPSARSDCGAFMAWAELCFLFSIWLEFVHDIGDFGRCQVYGQPPLCSCRYSAWSSDLRHVATALARHWCCSTHLLASGSSPPAEWALARLFLVMMDVSVEALSDESSASTDIHKNLFQRFARTHRDLESAASAALALTCEAWPPPLGSAGSDEDVAGSGSAPALVGAEKAEVNTALDEVQATLNFEAHFIHMSKRSVPATFGGLWGRGEGIPIGQGTVNSNC